jgi:hypothetical protein
MLRDADFGIVRLRLSAHILLRVADRVSLSRSSRNERAFSNRRHDDTTQTRIVTDISDRIGEMKFPRSISPPVHRDLDGSDPRQDHRVISALRLGSWTKSLRRNIALPAAEVEEASVANAASMARSATPSLFHAVLRRPTRFATRLTKAAARLGAVWAPRCCRRP